MSEVTASLNEAIETLFSADEEKIRECVEGLQLHCAAAITSLVREFIDVGSRKIVDIATAVMEEFSIALKQFDSLVDEKRFQIYSPLQQVYREVRSRLFNVFIVASNMMKYRPPTLSFQSTEEFEPTTRHPRRRERNATSSEPRILSFSSAHTRK